MAKLTLFGKMNPISRVQDRPRRIAFWAFAVGFVINWVLLALRALNGELRLTLMLDSTFFGAVFLVAVWSNYVGTRFIRRTRLCACLIFVHMWFAAFLVLIHWNGSPLTLPILLFAPICLVLVSDYKTMIGIGAVQTIAVFFYIDLATPYIYEIGLPDNKIRLVAIVISVITAVTFFVLTTVARHREKAEHSLVSLIQETSYLADHDPLTGLKNRRAIEREIAALIQAGAPFHVVYFDLDKFKPLNDEHGHAFGDQVLKEVGQRFASHSAVLAAARVGGDEFVLVMSEAEEFARDLKEIHRLLLSPIMVEGETVAVGASIGSASFPADAANETTLQHLADVAMMHSKARGGGYTKYQASMASRNA